MIMSSFDIVPLSQEHRAWADKLIQDHWGSGEIVTRGKVHDTSGLPGFVALRDGRPVGLTTYRIEGGECEMISLDSLAERIGIGSALVEAVMREASSRGCTRLWLITTNDNAAAVRFYQKRGFHLVAVHRNALEETRRLKPCLPRVGLDEIPLRDEIELEMRLSKAR
jgi:ribosomal protein S18 acetylase RimI-like enzyme